MLKLLLPVAADICFNDRHVLTLRLVERCLGSADKIDVLDEGLTEQKNSGLTTVLNTQKVSSSSMFSSMENRMLPCGAIPPLPQHSSTISLITHLRWVCQ